MDHLAGVLVQLFAILLAAKIGDEVFKRLAQPTVIGEILGGVVVGPAVLNVYQVNAETTLFAEIGVVLLLFQVGVETRLGDLLKVGGTAMAVGLLGVALPLAGGFALGWALGYALEVNVFLAAALTATSVGITSRVLGDIGALGTLSGRVILGAAVIDDVLAMLILAFAGGLAAGAVSGWQIATLVLLAVAFIGIVLLGGTQLLARRPSLLTDPEFASTPFLPGMILMLGLAALAALIGLAAIIGAFLAGMVVGESSEKHALEEEVAPVAAFFTPFFFGFIGAQVDLAALASLPVIFLLLALTAIAVATKFVGAFLGALRAGPARATLIGLGMVPRGEVGIVIAGLGLTAGAISGELYSVVVGMAILTTLMVPPLLPAAARRAEPERDRDPSSEGPRPGSQ
ncbi:MAG TPA: cation:proton antiporter [Candidatus Limnocylindria bacterium]|nr:cation:proton antiporter [Candidatus Limnocylindria bacterium]